MDMKKDSKVGVLSRIDALELVTVTKNVNKLDELGGDVFCA